MTANEIDLYSHSNYGNDGVLGVGNVEIDLSSKGSNRVGQGFRNSDEQRGFSRVSKFVKSKTAFMGTLFKPVYSSAEVPSEIRLSKRFGWRDMFAKLREKDRVIHINTAYKRKADKIKPVNLEKTTGEIPDGLSNWWNVLWAR